ncbi:porin [Burkholderia sp. WAC0059]|uniref:porin n=1 Tax=Burkholderia sp. WAC0059 TaxID=2066022 RepID=UPI000C7F200B|nr:porin [Burkholderia sp. WAC0059]PLZ00595.1 porin [Burkholderia sp. WAC0059]
MKRSLLVTAAICVIPLTAKAQSSVTIYGLIDEGVQFVNNTKNVVNGVNVGGRQFTLDSTNGFTGSQWGIRGSEDLGGGLNAIFTLESGLNLNNGQLGQGGALFGRQAFVGLSSNRFGALTLGRQYDMATVDLASVSTTHYIGGPATFGHPGDMDNFLWAYRQNNAIKYVSPDLYGLRFGAMISVGGEAGNATGNGGYSAGVKYSANNLNIGAAYSYFKNPIGAAGTGYFTNYPNGLNFLSGILNSNYVSATSYQEAGMGFNYTTGPATFGVTYTNVQYGNITTLSGATAHFNDVEAGFRWQFTPSVYAGLAYNYTKGSAVKSDLGNQHFNQFSTLVDYRLSTRTDVYATAAFQVSSGISSTGAPAVADIADVGDSSNNHQTLVRVGIRHAF